MELGSGIRGDLRAEEAVASHPVEAGQVQGHPVACWTENAYYFGTFGSAFRTLFAGTL